MKKENEKLPGISVTGRVEAIGDIEKIYKQTLIFPSAIESIGPIGFDKTVTFVVENAENFLNEVKQILDIHVFSESLRIGETYGERVNENIPLLKRP